MVEAGQPAQLLLQVDAGPDAGPEEVDALSRQLLVELADMQDVEARPARSSDQPPRGAKAGEATLVGTLAVGVLPALLPRLVDFLQGWVQRGDRRVVKIKTQLGDRSVELEYQPSAMSNQDLKKLVDLLTTSLEKKP